MTDPYVPSQDVTDFAIRSVIPTQDVFDLDQAHPGFLDAQIQGVRTAEIFGRLSKRYDVPTLLANEPEIIKRWISLLVTPIALQARGVNPTDQALINVIEWRKEALAELQEAANAVDGLYDLPLLPEGGASAITKGTPLAYSEASPFAWTDEQAARGIWEDTRCRR